MCDLVIQMINRAVPVPAAADRRRRWVRVGQQVRFPSGLLMDVQLHRSLTGAQDLRLRWHYGTHTMGAFTCYEPVNLVSDCGMRMVIRAVAMRAAVPVAVLVEIEAVRAVPVVAIGWAS